MLLTDKLHLGAGKISQISIGEKVDFEKFTLFLKKNLEFFVNINKEINDNYSNKLIDYIKENNKYLEILINKHVEIYTIKNFSNPEKIFRYLEFKFSGITKYF
jgi:hypothetical protein